MATKGFLHKKNKMDSPRKCSNCQKVFYIPNHINGTSVYCPHCFYGK